MRFIQWGEWVILLVLINVSVSFVQAQQTCDIDVGTIIQRVTDECADMDENEVCYGNRDVMAQPRINTINFVFEQPGDRADLYNITSLVVTSVDTSDDQWGVAQMRLQVGSENGSRDVTMLLFGRFEIENAVENTATVRIRMISFQQDMHQRPDLTSPVLATVESHVLLDAVGRLADSSWLRVENPENGIVGWIENAGLELVNSADSIGLLPVQDPDVPYYSAMQAFYFENGSSDLGCDTIASDGLLIQTPEGQARISLLINEVSIELMSTQLDDSPTGSTAFIQADSDQSQSMSVDVIDGQAQLETAEGSIVVNTGQQSAIPLSIDRAPDGAPSSPIERDPSTNPVQALLPLLAPESDNAGTDNRSNANNTTVTNTGNNSSSGIASDTGTVQDNGGIAQNSEAASSGNRPNDVPSSASNSQNSANNSNTRNEELDSNPFENPNPDLPDSVDDILNPPETVPRENPILSQGNIVALGIAIITGCIVLIGIIWNHRRPNQIRRGKPSSKEDRKTS